jgi:hypothetical protein
MTDDFDEKRSSFKLSTNGSIQIVLNKHQIVSHSNKFWKLDSLK